LDTAWALGLYGLAKMELISFKCECYIEEKNEGSRLASLDRVGRFYYVSKNIIFPSSKFEINKTLTREVIFKLFFLSMCP
jgi:hypothetical protein